MATMEDFQSSDDGPDEDVRREFLLATTATVGVVGVGLATWPVIDSMNPAADVLALASTELSLEPVETGQRITVIWRGKPVFVERRTSEQITQARRDDDAEMIDPEPDSARVRREEWLVVVGICTHLGCIPLGQKEADPRGEWGGWFCPCHGSHYDASGRIRKGPAPRNLEIPPYKFTSDTQVVIG